MKRSSAQASLEADGPPKRARREPAVSEPKKRPRSESLSAEDIVSSHISKKTKIDDSLTNPDTSASNPQVWPSIDEQQEPPITKIPAEWLRPVYEAFDQSRAAFKAAQEEYISFRASRLLSPVSGDEDSDSEADEFGCHPLMLGLENDDPRVEEVFGARYARQQQERRRHRRRRRQAASKPIPHTPAVPESSNHFPAAIATANPVGPLQTSSLAQPPSDCEGKRQSRKRESGTLPAKPRCYKARSRPGVQKEKMPSTSQQRFTRQRRPREFYELDHHGKSRRIYQRP